MLGYELWRKARIPITRHGNLDFTKLAGDRLGRLTIAYVAGGVGYRTVAGVAQMLVHFSLERGFDDGLGQLLKHAVFAN